MIPVQEKNDIAIITSKKEALQGSIYAIKDVQRSNKFVQGGFQLQ